MKQNKVIFATTLSFFLLMGLTLQAQINFSGHWKLNPSQSNFGNTPEYAAVKQFDITQNGNYMDVSRITENAAGDQTTNAEKDSIDAKPHSFQMKDGKIKTSTFTWSDDKKTLTILSAYADASDPANPTRNFSTTQIWSLSPDSKSLTVNLTTPYYSITAVYDKQ